MVKTATVDARGGRSAGDERPRRHACATERPAGKEREHGGGLRGQGQPEAAALEAVEASGFVFVHARCSKWLLALGFWL